MQFEVYSPAQSETLKPIEWNFEELKIQISEGLKKYKGIKYTDMVQAKADRANLNKLSAAIDAGRKEMKKKYLEPYSVFEAQCKELTGMISAASAEIDKQVKDAEKREKDEKLEKIKAFYFENAGDLVEFVDYDDIHKVKWLNKTESMSKIEKEILEIIGKINADLKTIESVTPRDIHARIMSAYLVDFDLSAALRLKESIEAEERRFEEYKRQQTEAEKVEPVQKAQPEPSVTASATEEEEKNEKPINTPPEEEKLFKIDFRAFGTKSQLSELAVFMKNSGIRYARIKEGE